MLSQVIEHAEGGSVLEIEGLEGGNRVGAMAGAAAEEWCWGLRTVCVGSWEPGHLASACTT